MISFTLGWKRNRLFLYSASREIVSINASIKEAAFGPPPFVDSFVVVGFCVFWVVGLHICVDGASLDTIALPAE